MAIEERLRKGFSTVYENSENKRITIDEEVASYLHDLCLFHEMELLKQKDLVKSTVLINQINKELEIVEIVANKLSAERSKRSVL